MYGPQIAALKLAIQKFVRPNRVKERYYIGDEAKFSSDGRSPAGVPLSLNGVSILQYSPYAGSDGGCPEARARIFEEINDDPPIDRRWAANVPSIKRDGAACKNQRHNLSRSLLINN
jgi:hypothetical protein